MLYPNASVLYQYKTSDNNMYLYMNTVIIKPGEVLGVVYTVYMNRLWVLDEHPMHLWSQGSSGMILEQVGPFPSTALTSLRH